jgi:hypothetical protein
VDDDGLEAVEVDARRLRLAKWVEDVNVVPRVATERANVLPDVRRVPPVVAAE